MAPSDGISEDVKKFIQTHIESVSQLEIFCLLKTTYPKPWTPEEIAQHLRTTNESATHCLRQLKNIGIVFPIEVDSKRYYRCIDVEHPLSKLSSQLVEAYIDRKVRVIELIYTKPRSALDELANAFRMRKDQDG